MTSDLTLALALLGGVVLMVVIAHSAWQLHKIGPKQADVKVARAEPREPVLGASPHDTLPGEPLPHDDPGGHIESPLGGSGARRNASTR